MQFDLVPHASTVSGKKYNFRVLQLPGKYAKLVTNELRTFVWKKTVGSSLQTLKFDFSSVLAIFAAPAIAADITPQRMKLSIVFFLHWLSNTVCYNIL